MGQLREPSRSLHWPGHVGAPVPIRDGVLASYLKNDRYPPIPIGTHCVAPRCRHIEGPVLHSAAGSQGKHSPPAPHCNVTVHEPEVDLLSQIVFDTTLPIDLGK